MEARAGARRSTSSTRAREPRDRRLGARVIRSRAEDGEALLGLARALDVDLVVVGPEAPLVAGRRRRAAPHRASPCSGPARGGAHRGLEALREGRDGGGGRPDRRARSPSPDAPCVVKADGLAAGKGVFVCRDRGRARRGSRARRAAFGGAARVEELLDGPRCRVFALCDGADVRRRWRPRQDFKRAYDGDTGPNTGGMGSYAPVPGSTATRLDDAGRRDRAPARRSRSSRARGTPFVGAALRRADADRGRPEGARVQLPLRRPGDAVGAAARRRRPARRARRRGRRGRWRASSSARPRSGGHRRAGRGRLPGDGRPRRRRSRASSDAEASGALVFHAGTALDGGRLVTNGGRILGVTGDGADARRGAGARLRRCRPDLVPGRAPAGRHRARRGAAG